MTLREGVRVQRHNYGYTYRYIVYTGTILLHRYNTTFTGTVQFYRYSTSIPVQYQYTGTVPVYRYMTVSYWDVTMSHPLGPANHHFSLVYRKAFGARITFADSTPVTGTYYYMLYIFTY